MLKHFQDLVERSRLGVRDLGAEMTYRTISNVAATPVAVFPTGSNTHWETENRVVWNAQEGTAEKQELVYEVNWVAELGAWRRFLRSRRKL